MIIGENERDLERIFDDFLAAMEKFDKKTSAQTQRKIQIGRAHV